GGQLAQPLVAQVTDQGGNPVHDMLVTFAVTSMNGGTVSPQAVKTDAGGLAKATLTLPKTVGPVQVTATPTSLLGVVVVPPVPPVPFNETAVAGPPAQFGSVPGNRPTGLATSTLAQPVVVTPRDATGNP